MSVPGQNNLALALTVIAKQTVKHFAFVQRVDNGIGQDVAEFAEGVDVVGSWQPVPRREYVKLGLNLTNNYSTFYTISNVQDIRRDRTGDQLEFGGKRYQVEDSNDWGQVDGWVGVLCVEISPALPPA